jgi:hypothetical protein
VKPAVARVEDKMKDRRFSVLAEGIGSVFKSSEHTTNKIGANELS